MFLKICYGTELLLYCHVQQFLLKKNGIFYFEFQIIIFIRIVIKNFVVCTPNKNGLKGNHHFNKVIIENWKLSKGKDIIDGYSKFRKKRLFRSVFSQRIYEGNPTSVDKKQIT